MKVLLGIIIIHLLVMLRARQSIRERVPYVSIFVLTVLMVTYVVAMMYTMEPPEQ